VVAATAMVSVLLRPGDLVNVSKVWGIGIIGLSMIPLIGFAGQISLCQLSFAGIGAVMVAHLGHSGNPLSLLWAAAAAAVVGAIVALPALRLSGIYLALSTGAFAVAMDRWLFPLPKFTVFGHDVDIFQGGSLTIHRVRLLGLRVDGAKAYLIFGAVAFSLLAMVVVAIQRSNFGQRLMAMKDSPAACATLGLNLTFTKLAVFALSAAIAGLGGAIYGGAVQTASAGVFDFFGGLPILMVMVVAGINSIGGALACGVFLGAPVLPNLFPSLKQLQTTLVGFAGIGLGKNPNGFIASDLRPRWRVVLGQPLEVAGLAAVLVTVWLMRLLHLMGNWPYALISLAVLAVAPVVAEAWHRSPGATAAAGPASELSGPLEWLGVTRPFLPEDVAVMDRVLAVPESRAHGAA
jgi:branched-chain amino acid transport system permease protein